MESVKKWLSERNAKKNGLYVHYSRPKDGANEDELKTEANIGDNANRLVLVVGVVSGAQLRQWARGGEESRLERAVLAGQGHRLLAEAEALHLSSHLPYLVAKCDALHAAVEKGSLLELQELLDPDYNRRKFVMCRDEAGVGLLHKAIFYDYMDIAQYLVANYPQLVHEKDSEGRTSLHYACMCRDEAAAAALLEGAGAVRGVRDAAGRTPAQYRGQARTLLTLPTLHPSDMARDNTKNPPGLVIKRHNIRIWCHDCDMARLQRVVWDGHGSRLLSEVSSQPVVKRFLEAVPYIMNTIRDIHSSVISNDLEGLMKHAGDPVPPQALSSRDANNMTVMHKAAGLGHSSILKYVVERYPQGINDIDNDGRTPLHYAAAMRDEQHTYNTLVSLGADESIVDNKNRTPAYYINRPQEIDKNLFKTLPDAPRTPSSAYPSNWDWKLLDTGAITELNKKFKRRNLKASSENISSKNNTNTISESTDCIGGMKSSNTHELIKDLPELEDTSKVVTDDIDTHEPSNVEKNEVTEETEVIEEYHVDENGQESNDIDKEDNTENAAEVETEQPENTMHEEVIEANEETPDEPEKTKADQPENNIENNSDTIADPPEVTMTAALMTEEVENVQNKESELKSDDENDGKNDNNKEDENDTDVQKNVPKESVLEIESSDDKDTNNHTIPEDIDDKCEDRFNDQNSNAEDYSNDNDDKNTKEEINPNETHELNNSVENGEESVENIEEFDTTNKEGNNNNEHNEDDDDVQVPGDMESDFSELHQSGTAEICDGSAKGDKAEISSGTIRNVNNGRSTQSTENRIEGTINGDAEQDSQDASMTQNDASIQREIYVVDSEIDPEVTDLINNSNMEMLATLVLNGEGSRLIGRHSANTELQAFLDNVPTYMQKINKVHVAAREGNIRDLQAALDRRKFAIARDPISPNGATPLHVATVFGKTNIIKYLGGRFPETLSAVDFEGRTALHYAAILPDNGHYYNLLQQLGANSKDLDDNGRSAEEYNKNPHLLPFDQLLTDFGLSEEAVQSMFADKGAARNDDSHMDIPIFHTEEGRYLAKSLGDPLIKGLTEVASVKPKDPVAFLASFLHNFPEKEKPRLNTQESQLVVTRETGEVENEQGPSIEVTEDQQPAKVRSAARTATRPRPIEVITVDPQPVLSPDAPETAFSSINRDEHGQSMLHFAAARTHARNSLFQLLQESDINLGYRDELYRTARDVSIQANVPENTAEIDKWVLHMAARGNTEKIMELLLEGYDHITDVVDENGTLITEVMANRGDTEMCNLLASIPAFEESRETLHGAVRRGDLSAVQGLLSGEGASTLARSRNSFGRTALHIAVLAQNEELVAYLAENFPELLRVGDNLERTPLHYAMAVDKIESLSRILIRAGAKRVLKDLKGRQPSYYFMNKSDILRLKEEEEVY